MMQQRLILALRSLRDVQGVLGSFVWRRDGLVVASDVPASCTPSALAAVAVRLQRLCEGFANLGEPFRSTTLVYRDRRIHVCGVPGAALAVVVSDRINMTALALALELSLRDLAQLGAALAATGSSGPLRPRASATPPPPPGQNAGRVSGVHPRLDPREPAVRSPSAGQPVRSYRGQRLGGKE